MGIKVYKGVKIMALGTHHNIFQSISDIMYATLVDATIFHTFVRIVNKLRYNNVVFL